MNPIVRLIFITASSILGIIFVVLGLNWLAHQTQYAAPDHPWLQHKSVRIYLGGKGNSTDDPAPFTPSTVLNLKLSANQCLHLPLRRTVDGHFVIFSDEEWRPHVDRDGFVIQDTLEDIKKIRFKNSQQPLVTLEDVLTQTPADQMILFQLPAQDAARYHGLADLLKKFDRTTQVGFTSPYKGPLEYLKSELPLALYGANLNQLGPAIALNSLGLSGLVNIDGDFVLVPFTYQGQLIFDESFVAELKRRKIPIYIHHTSAHTSLPGWYRKATSGTEYTLF